MKVIILLGFLAVGCGSTSKKIKDLPPLAKDAPVQVFYSVPNIKYEEVCSIEAKGNNSFGASYRYKEDFAEMFKEEARKCGADGVIFSSLHGYAQGSVTAYATGVKILSKEAGLTDPNAIKAFSLAIQSHDLPKVREIIAKIPKDPKERAPSDDQMINIGLYIATLDGLKCDPKMIYLLEKEYKGRVPKFEAINFFSLDKPDSNSPLCQNVMARSLGRMENHSEAVIKINNHYVGLLNNQFDQQLNRKAQQYNKLLVEGAKLITQRCQKSSVDPVCALKGAFVNVARTSKNFKQPAVRKNAADILAILSLKTN